jgi:hypothetical protein
MNIFKKKTEERRKKREKLVFCLHDANGKPYDVGTAKLFVCA